VTSLSFFAHRLLLCITAKMSRSFHEVELDHSAIVKDCLHNRIIFKAGPLKPVTDFKEALALFANARAVFARYKQDANIIKTLEGGLKSAEQMRGLPDDERKSLHGILQLVRERNGLQQQAYALGDEIEEAVREKIADRLDQIESELPSLAALQIQHSADEGFLHKFRNRSPLSESQLEQKLVEFKKIAGLTPDGFERYFAIEGELQANIDLLHRILREV
jgi:hypothetical protein